MNNTKKIFVVGSSRSGTTMMGRILGKHTAVFTFHELHFFEQLWDPTQPTQALTHKQAEWLAARLLTIQRDGYYVQQNPSLYLEEAGKVTVDLIDPITPPDVFAAMCQYETVLHGKLVACDQTPRNIFYLHEILELYPEARIIHMIRDSRDVLLSQKNKWRRRALGAQSIPRQQILRFWANYHPITMSFLWNSAIRAAKQFDGHERVFQLRFEDLLRNPETELRKLTAFLGIEYEVDMLTVPQVGSSHRQDMNEKMGIDPAAAGRWQHNKKDGMDIAVSEWFTRENLKDYNYPLSNQGTRWLSLIWLGITWPIKMGLSFLLNLGRTRNLMAAIKKRLGKASFIGTKEATD